MFPPTDRAKAAGSGCVDSDNPHPSSFLGSMVYFDSRRTGSGE